MKCFRHPDFDAVGVCRACGKGVCAATCAVETESGLTCGEACARRLATSAVRPPARAGGKLWPSVLTAVGVVLLYYGYRYSEFTMSVPNVLGLLFVWYGVVLLLQRAQAGRER